MLIIIEGPDKSGKTTLARAIEQEFNFTYTHFGFPGSDPADEYIRFFMNQDKPLVLDRSYFGEMVYGPLLRNQHHVEGLKLTVIERLCRLRGAIFIYASAPLVLCQERFKINMRNENVTLEQNEKAWYKFNELISGCNISPIIHYDSGLQGSIQDTLIKIRSYFSQLQAAIIASTVCTGIGTIYGKKFILVGEKINDRLPGYRLPFCSGPSSLFLNQCLQIANVPEKQVYLVNSNTLTEREIKFLNPQAAWLSLGDEADHVLNTFFIRHAKIPHPAYWRRFHSTEFKTYVDQLRLWKEANR